MAADREKERQYKFVVLVLVVTVCFHAGVEAFPGWIKCGGGQIPAFLFRCCGGIPYDATHMDGRSCCGKHTYFMEKEVCCDEVIVKRIEGKNCCGKVLYEQATERCCKDQVVAKTAGNASDEC
ncbi:hypothetical protein NP493_1682g00027 [Ridgeia piscesae]|uniref:Galaxin-like repeats domain-containing protein n=1 Tax=Ridgeia piscesae TaxID=27915 RepID=A0AAD9JW48_RIDPI|nr:hypothetical protein NP493_1682g00027 [Ridgeia piscesae]